MDRLPESQDITDQDPVPVGADQDGTPPGMIDDDTQLAQSPEEEILSAVAPKLTTVLADGSPE